jgi:hypothetical protein
MEQLKRAAEQALVAKKQDSESKAAASRQARACTACCILVPASWHLPWSLQRLHCCPSCATSWGLLAALRMLCDAQM